MGGENGTGKVTPKRVFAFRIRAFMQTRFLGGRLASIINLLAQRVDIFFLDTFNVILGSGLCRLDFDIWFLCS
jgi:hypothetical protein